MIGANLSKNSYMMIYSMNALRVGKPDLRLVAIVSAAVIMAIMLATSSAYASPANLDIMAKESETVKSIEVLETRIVSVDNSSITIIGDGGEEVPLLCHAELVEPWRFDPGLDTFERPGIARVCELPRCCEAYPLGRVRSAAGYPAGERPGHGRGCQEVRTLRVDCNPWERLSARRSLVREARTSISIHETRERRCYVSRTWTCTRSTDMKPGDSRQSCLNAKED